jgi:hypothetical protein
MYATQDLIERLAAVPHTDISNLQLVLLFAPKERKNDFIELLSGIQG